MLLMKLIVTLAFLFLILNLQATPQPKPLIQLATSYKSVDDISQYWLSEKLDGIRGYWDGEKLATRQGNLIHTPKWFTHNWPTTAMDGELWIGRNQFQQTLSCVRKIHIVEKCWRKVRFMIFDLPKSNDTFDQRIQIMQEISHKTNSQYLTMITQFKLSNNSQLTAKLDDIIAKEGEGLMLHLGSAYYHTGRTANIMKLKKHLDAEATVIGHIEGKGKYTGKLGALKVKMSDGTTFKIGSGFTVQERTNPPQIGTIISFKYNGKTLAGIPRFARYWRIRTPET